MLRRTPPIHTPESFAPFFLGTPFGWQSTHATLWMLWRLSGEWKVVSIASTSRPQLDRRGWQPEQDARVDCPCFW